MSGTAAFLDGLEIALALIAVVDQDDRVRSGQDNVEGQNVAGREH